MTETSTQAAPAPLQVRVKELEWRDGKAPTAQGSAGLSYVLPHDFDGWRWICVAGRDMVGVAKDAFDTLDAAKAAAQADYERRILSALDLSTPTQIAALEAAPVAFVSAGQFAALPADPADEGGAAYLPVRHGAAGQFQMPLYAAASVAALEAENVKLRERLATAYRVKAGCNDDAIFERRRANRAEAEVARLTEALKTVRLSLQTELERGVITDTLWMNDSPSETIFDALDASLTKGQSMHNSTALPPAPGSAAALALGCKCPVIDNGHGRGFRGIPDVFVYSGACELHNAQFGLAEAEIEKGQSNAQD